MSLPTKSHFSCKQVGARATPKHWSLNKRCNSRRRNSPPTLGVFLPHFCSASNSFLPKASSDEPQIVELELADETEALDFPEEEEVDDWFPDPGPGSGLQESVALALGALLLAAFLNVAWRLVIVVLSIAATAFKYSIVGILLLFFLLYYNA